MHLRRLSKEMREFEPILTRNGFKFVRTKGSHNIYVNPQSNRHIAVNNKLNAMVRLRLIKENNLEV